MEPSYLIKKAALRRFKVTPVALALLHAFTISFSHAASVVVTNGFDSNNGCTLREAIATINSGNDLGGCSSTGIFGNNDIINFDITSVSGLTAELNILSDVSFNATSTPVTISSLGNERIFNIQGSFVSFNDITISGGHTNGNISNGDPFVGNGGGLLATDMSTVVLTNSTISENSTSGTFSSGGGIAVVRSIVTLINSTVSSNSTNGFGSDGGGIIASYNSQISIIGSTVSGNSTGDTFSEGGAISIFDSTLTLTNSTMSGNSTSDFSRGGGIFGIRTEVTLTNSTVSGNITNDDGGGIYTDDDSEVSLINSIISGNTAQGGYSDIRFSSLDNINFFGNNLLGDNSNTTTQAFGSFTLPANVINATINGNQPTSLSAILSPLANNGGPTQTHALVDGSPAIGVGDNLICASEPINSLDQRGEPRPLIDNCDLGAFESVDLKTTSNTSTFVIPLLNGRTVIFDL